MKEVLSAIAQLDAWVETNGWAGWDPYDIKAHPLIIRLTAWHPPRPLTVLKRAALGIVELFPLNARRALGVSPRIYPKAMGLFAAAYTDLYSATGNRAFRDKAVTCAAWLLANSRPIHGGIGWGYPFDWQSRIFIPEGTPSGVVTATVGDGLYALYRCTGDRTYLSACESICRFFQNGLNVTHDSMEACCYSYTPLDDFQVHNANLFVGEFLTRIGTATGREAWVRQGVRCGNFALMEQQPQGFLPYWGLSQTDTYGQGAIVNDHYHSGFEIRMLYGLWKNTGREAFRQACARYLKWYSAALFDTSGAPKPTADSIQPVDIHACTEAILCLSTLMDDFPEVKNRLERVIAWTFRHMAYAPGKYCYRIVSVPKIGPIPIRIPMIRWGQAWMLRALGQRYAGDVPHGVKPPMANATAAASLWENKTQTEA